MGTKYTIAAGDTLAGVATKYGFHPDTVWMHPENESLRNLRKSPAVLVPGDVVSIPEKRIKSHQVPAGDRHRFVRRGIPSRLKVRLTKAGKARAQVPFRLCVEGEPEFKGETDEEGLVDAPISPHATSGKLYVGDSECYVLKLAQLLPVSYVAGVKARLANLGYLSRSSTTEAELRDALAVFQRVQGLEASGELDDTTRAQLVDAHGS